MGFSTRNHPIWGTSIYRNLHMGPSTMAVYLYSIYLLYLQVELHPQVCGYGSKRPQGQYWIILAILMISQKKDLDGRKPCVKNQFSCFPFGVQPTIRKKVMRGSIVFGLTRHRDNWNINMTWEGSGWHGGWHGFYRDCINHWDDRPQWPWAADLSPWKLDRKRWFNLDSPLLFVALYFNFDVALQFFGNSKSHP